MAVIWHEEATVDAHDQVHQDDYELGGEVENVEARCAVVPGHRRMQRCRVEKRSAAAEAGTEGEKSRRGEKDDDLSAKATCAKLVDVGAPRDGKHEGDNGYREEGDEGEPAEHCPLDVAVDVERMRVQRVERVNDNSDDHENADNGKDHSHRWNQDPEWRMPAYVWVARPHETLCEEEVDNEEDDSADGDEDFCCYAKLDVARLI